MAKAFTVWGPATTVGRINPINANVVLRRIFRDTKRRSKTQGLSAES